MLMCMTGCQKHVVEANVREAYIEKLETNQIYKIACKEEINKIIYKITKVSHPLKHWLFPFTFACGPPYPLSFNTCLIEVMQTVHMLHPIFPMLPPLQGF